MDINKDLQKKVNYNNDLKEKAKVIRYNKERIRQLPQRVCPDLCESLAGKNKNVRTFLQQLLTHFNREDAVAFLYNGQFAFHLSTELATVKVRKRTTHETTSKYFNYLCALGLLQKECQSVGNSKKLTQINQSFLKKNPHMPNALNLYIVPKYTNDYLKFINHRARMLSDCEITCGNISKNRLIEQGLTDLANEVFPNNLKKAYTKKVDDLGIVTDVLDTIITSQGYAHKSDLYRMLHGKLSRTNIDRILSIFKERIAKKYTYKRPNIAEKEQFGLHNNHFIYQRKDIQND